MFNTPVLTENDDLSDAAFHTLLTTLAGLRPVAPLPPRCEAPLQNQGPSAPLSNEGPSSSAIPPMPTPTQNFPAMPAVLASQLQRNAPINEGAYPLPPFLQNLAHRAAQNLPTEQTPHQGNLNQRPSAPPVDALPFRDFAHAPAQRRARTAPYSQPKGPDSSFLSLLNGSRDITGIQNPALRALFNEFTPFKLHSDPVSFRRQLFEKLAELQTHIEMFEERGDWESVAMLQKKYNELYASYHSRYLPLSQNIGHKTTINLIKNQAMSHSSGVRDSNTLDVMLDLIQNPEVMNAFTKIFLPNANGNARARTPHSGALPSLGGIGRSSAASVTDVTEVECNYCHELGHWKSTCPKLKKKIQDDRNRGNDRGPPGPPGGRDGRNPN